MSVDKNLLTTEIISALDEGSQKQIAKIILEAQATGAAINSVCEDFALDVTNAKHHPLIAEKVFARDFSHSLRQKKVGAILAESLIDVTAPEEPEVVDDEPQQGLPEDHWR